MPDFGASTARVYAALLENSNDCIVVLASDGRTVFQSRAVADQLGYLPYDLVGRDNFSVVHPDDQAAAAERFRAALVGEPTPLPIRLRCRHKDGRWRTLEFTTSRFVESDEIFVVLNARDVTDILEATAALRASEHRLDLALELGDMGVSEFDYRTRELIFSTSFARLMGYAAPPEGADLPWLLQHVHPDDRATVATISEQVIETPARRDSEILFRLIRRDGATRWWSGRIRVVNDDEGRPSRAIGLVSDITERRLLEEQVRQAQKLEAIGRLAGGIAHDFNNLLTVITGYADTLIKSVAPDDPRYGDVVEIERAAERAALLTEQLLAFSRKRIVRPGVLDANAVIRAIATMVGRLIGPDIELRMNLARAGVAIVADRGQLEQVLINLAVNARDAMPAGGVLDIRTSSVTVTEGQAAHLYPMKPGEYVHLSVCDSGVGMSADVQARIFEPFFTTKDPGKGTGIGLATVYGIVKQSGGFVFVTSEAGVGSTFDVYLPLANTVDAEAAPGRRDEAHQPQEVAATILLVEDFQRVRDLARKVLAGQGYRVLAAQSGQEALEIAGGCAGDIDVLLTDVVMPGISGPELAREIHRRRPRTVVVFMSGHPGDVLDREGVNPDTASFLEKPFTPAALSRKIHDALTSRARDT